MPTVPMHSKDSQRLQEPQKSDQNIRQMQLLRQNLQLLKFRDKHHFLQNLESVVSFHDIGYSNEEKFHRHKERATSRAAQPKRHILDRSGSMEWPSGSVTHSVGQIGSLGLSLPTIHHESPRLQQQLDKHESEPLNSNHQDCAFRNKNPGSKREHQKKSLKRIHTLRHLQTTMAYSLGEIKPQPRTISDGKDRREKNWMNRRRRSSFRTVNSSRDKENDVFGDSTRK